MGSEPGPWFFPPSSAFDAAPAYSAPGHPIIDMGQGFLAVRARADEYPVWP